MITLIKRHSSSFFKLFQGRSDHTIIVATGMSVLLVGISLYLFVFAGRSMLPAPLSGAVPVTPHIASVPVTNVALIQPVVEPPVNPPQAQPVLEPIVTSASVVMVASSLLNPERSDSSGSDAIADDDTDNKTDDDGIDVFGEVPRDEHRSERRDDDRERDKDRDYERNGKQRFLPDCLAR